MSIVPHNLPHLGWTGLVNMYDVIAAAGAEQLKKDETTWLRSKETDSGKTDQLQTPDWGKQRSDAPGHRKCGLDPILQS